MISNFSKSMLKQTLAPVVFVVVLWILMSSVTTYYVQWLERSHQRIFVDNTMSIRAAETLQILVWRLAANCPGDIGTWPEFRVRCREVDAQIDDQRQKLGQSAFTHEESKVLAKLDDSLTSLHEFLRQSVVSTTDQGTNVRESVDLALVRLQANEIASRITASANELLKLNQDLTDQDTLQRQKISRFVYLSRLGMLVIGPLLGVLLGWRLARLLHRSIARIAVTLHDASSSSESDVGSIAIESSGDFQDIQQQAEKVAERMRLVSHDLQVARREVLQAERLAAVGELAAGVAHEIRNPLTSVKLLLQHALRQASGPTLDESKLELILEEIGRMETTIQGLLDFSRPPSLKRVKHDLWQTLQRAINLVDARARQQDVEIITHCLDNPLIVDGDAEKLHQVLVNLLINAIEAMPEGGCLTIEATIVERPMAVGLSDSETRKRADDCLAQIVIRDTGQGIPVDVLPRLFEPFATTKERGTGLGLAVSHRIVEEHRGTIQACNLPGGGAQFTLKIPLADTKVPTSLLRMNHAV